MSAASGPAAAQAAAQPSAKARKARRRRGVNQLDAHLRLIDQVLPPEGVPLKFEVADLGARFGAQIVDILLRGRNLTDEEARSHTSFLKNVAPLPGRNVTLSLRFQF